MLTSIVVIRRPLLNFLVPFRPPPRTEAGCNWLELSLVVQEQFFRRSVGYVYRIVHKSCNFRIGTAIENYRMVY